MNNKVIFPVVIVSIITLFIIVGLVIMNNNDNNSTELQNDANKQHNAVTKNIVETASSTDNLSTLVAAVQAGDLVDALSKESADYTVFAPSNSAFSAIQQTVDQLLQPQNKSDLQAVLQYHVVPTRVLSSELSDGQIVETLSGKSLKVRIVDGMVYINDAKVQTADIETTNGVVHIIDKVLVPDTFGNVVDTAIANQDLSTLVAAVKAAELVTALSNEDAEFTVFAPTNEAFATIEETVNELLKPENKTQLQTILQYHVVSKEVFAAELTNGQKIETLTGEMLEVSIENGKVYIIAANSKAQVIAADQLTRNGIVHVIDTVLLP